ncbi:hemophore-related protein [Mycolicibacterium tusciae]|uniref:hemophore-related protein n=1 Tax=Mycolicibacterium tusciae TaxID=75922 RepID=UPI00024A12DF|nr:hemophore-related protein [Mycolicibacterium tusciae]
MMRLMLTRLAAGVGGLALSVTAAAGVASAQPNIDAMVNSTCTYDQAIAAVNAENPTAAKYLNASPANLEFVRVFLSSSADQRVSLLNQVKNNPGIDQAIPVFSQMMTSCVNY